MSVPFYGTKCGMKIRELLALQFDHWRSINKGPVINSSREGDGRHLDWGDQKYAHSKGGGMKNKEHFKRKTMEFLLKP